MGEPKFKIGDIVLLRHTSSFWGQSKGTMGTITDYPSEAGWCAVAWEYGYSNSYREIDLYLATDHPIKPESIQIKQPELKPKIKTTYWSDVVGITSVSPATLAKAVPIVIKNGDAWVGKYRLSDWVVKYGLADKTTWTGPLLARITYFSPSMDAAKGVFIFWNESTKRFNVEAHVGGYHERWEAYIRVGSLSAYKIHDYELHLILGGLWGGENGKPKEELHRILSYLVPAKHRPKLQCISNYGWRLKGQEESRLILLIKKTKVILQPPISCKIEVPPEPSFQESAVLVEPSLKIPWSALS